VLAKHSSQQEGLKMNTATLENTTWMCGFCNIPFVNDSHCLECNRYDGAMTQKEYANFMASVAK
jgi:hypothetical protein